MQPQHPPNDTSIAEYIQVTFGWIAGLASNWLAAWLDRYVFLGLFAFLLVLLIPLAIMTHVQKNKAKGFEGSLWGLSAGILSSLIANLLQDKILNIGTPFISFFVILILSIVCLVLSQNLPHVRQLLSRISGYRMFLGPGIFRDILGGLLATLCFIALVSISRVSELSLVECFIGLFVTFLMGVLAALLSGRPRGSYFAAFMSGIGLFIYGLHTSVIAPNPTFTSDPIDFILNTTCLTLFLMLFFILAPLAGAWFVSAVRDP
jgi:hypothetical protein